MSSSKGTRVKNKRTKRRSADLAEIAFERLRQAILNGELKEGEKVREARLAADWSIGITPLREAVRRMAALGHLVLKPNHAPIVRKLSTNDIQQIYALRAVLECFALQSAWKTIRQSDLTKLESLVRKAERALGPKARLQTQLALDAELHQLWSSPKNNPWLASSLERLLIYRPNLMNVLAAHTEFADRAFDQHKRILQALQKRDLAKTLELLSHHIETSGSVLTTLTSQ